MEILAFDWTIDNNGPIEFKTIGLACVVPACQRVSMLSEPVSMLSEPVTMLSERVSRLSERVTPVNKASE